MARLSQGVPSAPLMHVLPTLLSLVLLVLANGLFGQSKKAKDRIREDTLYVMDLSRRPTLRLYGSNKFNSMVVRSNKGFTDLRYRPNGKYIFGVGASYRRLTLNIGVPMPFVNTDNDRFGRTRYLDAQANLHTPTQSSNLFLQVFKGYHITSHAKDLLHWDQTTDFPYREDLLQYNIGLSTLRILNPKRFSYRAAFNQDAWQKRSQGSWLAGGYLTCYVVNADSGLVPTRIANEFTERSDLRKGVFLDLGVLGGYAYTLVVHRHWFATISAAIGGGPTGQFLTSDKIDGAYRSNSAGFGWHAQFRGALGYNSRTHYMGVIFNQENIGYLMGKSNGFAWDVGNVRLIFAMRLQRKAPKVVERGFRWLEKETPVPVAP
ncbi:MAG TPA: DUF4421 family protein [Flavobacteriales bacterium]|nr:DUF4421 family protein [Flavobacteriales bacterium]